MDWLTNAFAQYSVAGIVLSAVVGLLSGGASSWITYQFKKQELLETTELKKQELREEAQLRQEEIVATALEDIKKQRQLQVIEQKKERDNRIREQIVRWAPPISRAVGDLEHRLHNILYRGGGLALNKHGQVPSNWSITYDYFMSSTLYLFAQYFARIEMLWGELSFELFQSEQNKDEFFNALNNVSEALGRGPSCQGEDRQVFRLQQRAIGELLILRDSEPPKCMSYPDFVCKLQEESFERHIAPLRALVENVNSSMSNECRWKRLDETRNALIKLSEQCDQVLKLPEELEDSPPK